MRRADAGGSRRNGAARAGGDSAFARVWRSVRFSWSALFFVGSVVAMLAKHWGVAGVGLVIAAILLPKLRRS